MILFSIGAMCLMASAGGLMLMPKGGADQPKDTLHTCFARARLYIRHKNDKDWVYTYPAVNGHEVFEDREEYTFTLPIGVDPERLHKYLWVFEQGFGPHVDLVGEAATYTLKVYKEGIKQFSYNFSDIPLDGYHLPIVAGRSREGWEVYDMTEHPQLLIAGETGSGKSTELRVILTTLILHKKPSELELYLADLKRSEFHLFKGLEHVKAVVNNKEDLKEVLDHVAIELAMRGNLCDKYEVDNIINLPFKIPFIMVAIDEVALLKKDTEIMKIVGDIAATGRALGVFVCLSMQRPDSKLLESGIKTNMTVRMAFKHADDTNSQITLDQSGAEELTTKGLMLLKREGIKRVQSPYLTLPEAKRLLKGSL